MSLWLKVETCWNYARFTIAWRMYSKCTPQIWWNLRSFMMLLYKCDWSMHELQMYISDSMGHLRSNIWPLMHDGKPRSFEANIPQSQNDPNQDGGFSPQLPNQNKASMRSFKSSKDLRKSQRISWQKVANSNAKKAKTIWTHGVTRNSIREKQEDKRMESYKLISELTWWTEWTLINWEWHRASAT